MSTTTDHHDTGPRRVGRALAALAALGVLIAVVPVVLVALTQALPLDPGALSPAAWGHADDGRILLLAIVAVAWSAWAVMVFSIGLETWAAVRRVPTPSLPGMAVPQRLAAGLVAAVLVTLSPAPGVPAIGAPVASPESGPSGVVAVVAAASFGADRIEIDELREPSLAPQPARRSLDQSMGRAAPTVTTERHDTLWLLAEQYLGGGERYVEIVELNQGMRQPDGRSLGDDGRIYPGWTLALPEDATVDAVRTERHAVVRGDTLWEIAGDELGDPTRYPEIAEVNRGDLQPDGRHLTDADLILPGWVLEIPGTAASEARSETRSEVDGPEGGRGRPATTTDTSAADGDPSPHAGATIPAPEDEAPATDGTSDDATSAPSGSVPSPSSPAMAPIDRSGSTSESLTSAPDATSPADQTATPGGSVDAASGLPTLDRATRARATAGVVGPAESLKARSESEPAWSPPASTPPASTPPEPSADSPVAGSLTATPLAADAEPMSETAPAAGAAISLPAGGAVAALLLAGVGAELVRRRRQFQRHRRPGERMPTAGPGAQEVERAARTAGSEPGLDLLDAALIQLAEEAEVGGNALPDVRVVRVSADSVVLELAAPAVGAIAPFVAADPTRWVLSPALLASEPPDRARALAGLVTLGFSGAETILLNLESVGTLAVAGPLEVTRDVLRGLAAELAFGPCAALTERILCVADPTIVDAVEAGGIGIERDPQRAAAALGLVMAADSSGPAVTYAEPAAAPVDPHALDPLSGDPLLIVLSDRELDLRVPPRSGCALITTAPVAGAGASLVLDDSGRAVLLPERENLTAQFLSQTTTRDMVEALSATDLPDAGLYPTDVPGGDAGPDLTDVHGPAAGPEQPAATDEPTSGQAGLWESPTSSSEVIDLRESIAMSGAVGDSRWSEEQRRLPFGLDPKGSVAPPTAGAVPRVLVLGEVLVENAHGKCESTRIGRLAETAAFVLLNPGSRPSELQGALWPGRRSNPQTCRQMISRARTWLGRTDAGEPYLMTFAESGGRLRLRPEVGSDWADFQRLAELGLADPEDVENLTAALSLVRGRPFGAVASRELPWADLHINEMISLIGDVAHALALRHERAGRRSAARNAALRGLQTESESEVLEEIVARTVV